MIQPFARKIGRFALDRVKAYIQMGNIFVQTANAVLHLALFKHAVQRATVREIHSAALGAVPVVLVTALLLGSITVHYLLVILTGLKAYDRIGEYLFSSLFHEIAPVTCVIILLLRTGTRVLTEIASMKHDHELDTLHMLDIGLPDYVYLPRLMAFIVAGFTLTICFALTSLVGGYLVLGFMQDITFDNYLDQLTNAAGFKSFAIPFLKSITLSFLVGLITLQKGMSVKDPVTEVPGCLVQIMLHTMFIIFVVEYVFHFLF